MFETEVAWYDRWLFKNILILIETSLRLREMLGAPTSLENENKTKSKEGGEGGQNMEEPQRKAKHKTKQNKMHIP